ncbi:M56 family metallopeptidase [Taibaiella chishuiensis]|uniref:Beta-lactamase regulating signal transducer with metallopeptidase domain n=1 Tax=Taibaiella chishuiensis TaxID=1434707 RepID=A0A2P8D2V1_9BACT|nr:M56 family metallopeptidase [Taibaiella chishuiensis]PSK91525.1 beta-lactamase regulating signal transducer with metallopeptidase domain [Taibaiella chishuiensis]
MWIYLLKVTIVWSLLLACFELLYRRSPYYRLNRLYLLLTLVLGVVLPALPLTLPEAAPADTGIVTLSRITQPLQQLEARPVAQVMDTEQPGLGAWLKGLYYTGALVVLLLCLYDVVLIFRKAVYGSYQVYEGHRIFNTGRSHAPFSFFGWIFIGRPEVYSDTEIRFILKHEDTHNQSRHWLDVLILQCFLVVFWFHPLVWRIRHLLKLQHEYEADHYAASDDPYSYGHFLLQQTLLKAPHPIAHSFHYSPIKNRIAMLTQAGKKSTWKYLALVPALMGCTLLMARTNDSGNRVRTGDATTYRGNILKWRMDVVDTILVQDAVTKEVQKIWAIPDPQIIALNGAEVYPESSFTGIPTAIVPQFRYKNQSVHEYLKAKLLEQLGSVPDSLLRIDLVNMVVNAEGKIVYYDVTVTYSTRNPIDRVGGQPAASAPGYYSRMDLEDRIYTPVIDKIVNESPEWMPAMLQGKAVPAFLLTGSQLVFHDEPRAFKARKR